MCGNGLPLAAVGDFGAQNCQPSTNVDRSTALDLTTSVPIASSGCYRLAFFSVVGYMLCSSLNYALSFLPPNEGKYFSMTLKIGGLSSCDLLSNVLLGFCAVMTTS